MLFAAIEQEFLAPTSSTLPPVGDIAGNWGEPPSANEESCPFTAATCGDELDPSAAAPLLLLLFPSIISSLSESSNDDEACVIHGIGDSRGEDEGDGEERNIGLVVELEEVVEACPSIEVSAGPGDKAYVSATYADATEETLSVLCRARKYLIAVV